MVAGADPGRFSPNFLSLDMPSDNTSLEIASGSTLDDWISAWPDAVAFVAVLAIAWWAGWQAGDLVWSLWLSSFVVGYSTIVWMIVQPATELWRVFGGRTPMQSSSRPPMAFSLILVIGALFFLAFFTFHFGMFHYVHSQFLISFFPVEMGDGTLQTRSAGFSTYLEVARRYWPALPSAFLAHRAAFLRKPLSLDRDFSLATFTRDNATRGWIIEPYRNVLRMHVLIFFFFFAHFLKLENFAVYAVVYAVYFFPWRLVRRPAAPATSVLLP